MIIFLGRTHIALNLALYLAISRAFHINSRILFFGAFFIIIGSILADIDSENSLIGRFTFIISAVIEHRGFSHTVPGALMFAAPLLLMDNKVYFWMFLWSYFLHLGADSLTPAGVKLFYPVSKKKYSMKLIKTGSGEEGMIFLMCLGYILLG